MWQDTERQTDLIRLQVDHLSRYRWACQWATGARCLDLGCGTGYGSRILAGSGALMVTGVDISEEAVNLARSHGDLRNLEFCLGDATAPKLAGFKYDLITCFEVIEHLVEPAAILTQIRTLIADNGVALISTPNADVGYGGNPFHLSEMSAEQFRTLVGRHFKRATWFAQFDPDQRWHRPDWQRKLIRRIPRWARRLRPPVKTHAPESPASEPSWQKFDCRNPFCCDDYYPMPWDLAMESMYTPPPNVILAAVQP